MNDKVILKTNSQKDGVSYSEMSREEAEAIIERNKPWENQFKIFDQIIEKVSDDKEYILCAAVHFGDGKKHEHQPQNIKKGFVIAGRRHHNCFCTAWILGYDRKLSNDRDIQGFITSWDRFVDRDEAALIAKKAGQADVDSFLISENLY